MSGRPGFMLYFEAMDALGSLGDAEAGALFKALMAYARYGEVQTLSGMAEFAFQLLRGRIDRDAEIYREKCMKNAYNAHIRISRQHNQEPMEYAEWERTTIVNDRQPTTTTTATATATTTATATAATTTTATATAATTTAAATTAAAAATATAAKNTKTNVIFNNNSRQGSSPSKPAGDDTAWVLPYLAERPWEQKGEKLCRKSKTG